ncbi:hypothetical protein AB0O70_00135 [Microbacterium paraoxydans]|jgi:hypothetical protein|uniref:hypothetical protein n=1 Tax=Microbacterium TaxID=33882 RepID=UPI00131A2E2C|nr:hypothetical protein [Microbacterium sp. str. 'China']
MRALVVEIEVLDLERGRFPDSMAAEREHVEEQAVARALSDRDRGCGQNVECNANRALCAAG